MKNQDITVFGHKHNFVENIRWLVVFQRLSVKLQTKTKRPLIGLVTMLKYSQAESCACACDSLHFNDFNLKNILSITMPGRYDPTKLHCFRNTAHFY